jgi:hypothetical protein
LKQEEKRCLKFKTLAAISLVATLFVAPAIAQMAVPPPTPPHGNGAYDQNHHWHDRSWWNEHDSKWTHEHHPERAEDGAWDKDHHWHSRDWWVKKHPKWAHKHHPDWFSK